MSLKKLNLKQIEKDILEIAKKSGNLILKYKKRLDPLKIESKKAQGVVSEADFASEELIMKFLSKKYPEIPFLAEEDFFKNFKGQKEAYKKFQKEELLWIIDPLDGTNNFLHGLDMYCVCISLVYKGKPIVGVVYAPERKETFLASKGNGSYFIKGSIKQELEKVRGKSHLRNILLATGFATEKGEQLDIEFDTFFRMMGHVRGIRRLGSAALDLCYVANGIFDGFWERDLAPWDVAAAGIICTEAGVHVSEYDGSKHSPFSSTILVARKPLHKKLQNIITE